jgi:hypothetical protein
VKPSARGQKIDGLKTDFLKMRLCTGFLASASSPEIKSTVRGLEEEKSEIQAIGTEINAFTTLAPGARSATISLEVRPEMSPKGKV